MTRREIERAIYRWQERLNLGHWRISLDTEIPPEDESSVMQVDRTRDYLTARIRVARNWRSWTADAVGLAVDETEDAAIAAPARTLDEMVAHELLHITLHDLGCLPDWIDGMLHRDVAELVDRRHEHELERVVEELARAFTIAYARS